MAYHIGSYAAHVRLWDECFDSRQVLQRRHAGFRKVANNVDPALFFAEIGFSDARIGLFMTLTLAGDVLLGTFLTLIADKIGRRRILLAGSFLMVLTGGEQLRPASGSCPN